MGTVSICQHNQESYNLHKSTYCPVHYIHFFHHIQYLLTQHNLQPIRRVRKECPFCFLAKDPFFICRKESYPMNIYFEKKKLKTTESKKTQGGSLDVSKTALEHFIVWFTEIHLPQPMPIYWRKHPCIIGWAETHNFAWEAEWEWGEVCGMKGKVLSR